MKREAKFIIKYSSEHGEDVLMYFLDREYIPTLIQYHVVALHITIVIPLCTFRAQLRPCPHERRVPFISIWFPTSAYCSNFQTDPQYQHGHLHSVLHYKHVHLPLSMLIFKQ